MSEDVGKQLLSRVRSALDDGLTVRVVTVVGEDPSCLQKLRDTSWATMEGEEQPSIVSEFDLVDGDVRYFVSKSFLEEEAYGALSREHAARERLALERVSANFQLLRELYDFAKSELGELRAEVVAAREA